MLFEFITMDIICDSIPWLIYLVQFKQLKFLARLIIDTSIHVWLYIEVCLDILLHLGMLKTKLYIISLNIYLVCTPLCVALKLTWLSGTFFGCLESMSRLSVRVLILPSQSIVGILELLKVIISIQIPWECLSKSGLKIVYCVYSILYIFEF